MNSRTSMAQREEIIKRTVYVSDIDQQVFKKIGFFSRAKLVLLVRELTKFSLILNFV